MPGALESITLTGRSVVVTRAREQAGDLIERLESLGAEVLLLPTVSFIEPEDTSQLDAAINGLEDFDWVLLTSQNAVRFFCKRLSMAGKAGAGPRYAAVGAATARAAGEEGLNVAHIASQARGEILAHELKEALRGKRVFLPRSDRARADLPAALREAGAQVTEVVAYRTLAAQPADPSVLERIRRGKVDVLTFASPSAFHNLADELGVEALQGIAVSTAFAAIGPVTAQAIREAFVPVEIEASESGGAGLVAAIAGHFARKSSAGARA